jgi:hypothetical protein
MKGRTIVSFLLFLAFILPLAVHADQDKDKDKDREDRGRGEDAHHEHNVKTPVNLIGVIPIPGNPITSADISWVDPGTERYYFADRTLALTSSTRKPTFT